MQYRMSIPKIIHQTFSSYEGMPAMLKDNCERIRRLNRDHEYRFYDNTGREAFIQSFYDEKMFDRYKRIHSSYGAAQADFFRYLCIYACGGVYLDVKADVRKPLSTVINNDDVYLLSQWNQAPGSPYAGWGTHRQLQNVSGGEFQQWHVIASPGHPFLAAVINAVVKQIDHYNPLLFRNPWDCVMSTTGPIPYTASISSILNSYPHRFVDTEKDLGIFYSVLSKPGNLEAHRTLYRDYRASIHPLINPRWPLSWLFPTITAARLIARRTRQWLEPSLRQRL
jgi:mannosyltransferase OCH1-like enzyme